jgi:hypothetical protein
VGRWCGEAIWGGGVGRQWEAAHRSVESSAERAPSLSELGGCAPSTMATRAETVCAHRGWCADVGHA